MMAEMVLTAVWKFPLPRQLGTPIVPMMLPRGAQVLHVGIQNDTICLWARCDASVHMEQRVFAVCGTGQDCPPTTDGVHIGTVFEGPFVWHVFERVSR